MREFLAFPPPAASYTFGVAAEADRAVRESRRAFIVALSVTGLVVALSQFPIDDGLRHVGLAFGEQRSWGHVYPFSIFALSPSYDPWFGYDLLLRSMASLLKSLPFSRLVLQWILVKIVSLTMLFCFLALVVARSRLLSTVRDRRSLTIAVMLVAACLGLTIYRILLIRPFAIGSIFLIYAVAGRGVLRGALSAGALAFFYPYLFWLYSLPAALAHLIRGSRAFAIGVLAATIGAVLLQPAEFWSLLRALHRSDQLRSQLPAISELAPPSLFWCVLALGLGIIALPFLSAESKKVGVPHLLFLFFLPVALKYRRYVLDVEIVLLFIIFGKDIVRIGENLLERFSVRWHAVMRTHATRSPILDEKRRRITSFSRAIRVLTIVICATFLGIIGWLGRAELTDEERLRDFLAQIPKRSLVLTSFGPQYRLLYVRPDLRLVPSCEIGFPAPSITKEYLGFINDGEVSPLASAVGASFLIEDGGVHFVPAKMTDLQLEGEYRPTSSSYVRLWRIGRGSGDG